MDNIQRGVDNCATYYVGKEDLEKLKTICEEVLKHPEKAEELLPTQEGFFFGTTDYDEWYFNDIQDTIEICKWCYNRKFRSSLCK